MKPVKWVALLLSVCLLGGLFAGVALPTVETEAATSIFTFDGTMSKETLRAYCSRAVTLQGFCVENTTPDPIFEEDLRMIRRIGAKYIGRAALYSWGGHMSWEQVQEHFRVAKERAALAHEADPELILQGGVYEIIYRGTVNATPVPAYVFEAFGLPVEQRNFRYLDMVYDQPGHRFYYKKDGGYWNSGAESAVPNIAELETQMYFYWQITRYIDAGFEAVHLGQAEMMADNNTANFIYWDKVTTMARAYAEVKARRGIILFDCHSSIHSGGMKVGDRLICDIQGAGIVPNETVYEDGVFKCEIADHRDVFYQWIGRSDGGQHPLGFEIESNYTILEFDNHGISNHVGTPTYASHYTWGWDDISWLAMQPEWYRNQFLLECQEFLTTHNLDSNGEQQYFLQPACRRVIVVNPVLSFTIADAENHLNYVMDYLEEEKTSFVPEEDGSWTLTVSSFYRANNPSDGCPNGFGQEDTIREIFLGKDHPEDPALTGCVVPSTTAATKKTIKATAKPTTKVTAATNTNTAKPAAGTTAEQTTATADKADSGTTTYFSAELATTTVEGTSEATTTAPFTPTDTDPDADMGGIPAWVWVAIAVVAVLAVAGIVVWLLIRRKKR